MHKFHGKVVGIIKPYNTQPTLITSKRDQGQEPKCLLNIYIYIFFLLIWVFHLGFNKILNGGRWNKDEIDSESNQALCLLIYPHIYFSLLRLHYLFTIFCTFWDPFYLFLSSVRLSVLCVCLQIESWQYFSVAVSPCLYAFCVLCYVCIFYILSYFYLFICNDASWVQAWAQIVCTTLWWASWPIDAVLTRLNHREPLDLNGKISLH